MAKHKTIYSRDFKDDFRREVTELLRDGVLEIEVIMLHCTRMIDDYIEFTDQRPDVSELERITNRLLKKWLTDNHPDKMSREEYPILSDYQLARRQYGAHKSKKGNARIEVPLSSLMNVATDGRDYSYPSRRKRTIEEMIWMDENTKSRNEERRIKYNEFRNGKMENGQRVFSKGIFTVDVSTGQKIIHDLEKYLEMFPWEIKKYTEM